MKQFVVLKQISTFEPTVSELFDSEDDAQTYATVMRKTHPTWKFKVYEMKGSAL